MIECRFGWGKQHGTRRKTKHRGLAGVAADFLLNMIGYTLIRIPKLLAQRGEVRPHTATRPDTAPESMNPRKNNAWLSQKTETSVIKEGFAAAC